MSHLQILRYPQDISSALLGKQLLALENMAWSPDPDDADVFPVEPDTYVTSFVLLSEDNTPLSHVAIRRAVLHHRAISYRVYGISEVITHPAHRRRGYAAQLLRQAAAWIPQQGADLCLFTCAPALVPLYSKNGWPPIPGACLVGGKRDKPFRSDSLQLVTVGAFYSARARLHQQEFSHTDICLELGENQLW